MEKSLYLLLLNGIYSAQVIVYAHFNCNEPAEEGTAHTIRFNITKANDTFCNVRVTSSSHGFVANCTTPINCNNALPRIYNASLDSLDRYYVLTVHIYKVSRVGLRHDQRMHIYVDRMDRNDLYEEKTVCQPNIYSLASALLCDTSHSNNFTVKITCSTPKVFPEAKCLFSSTLDIKNYSIETSIDTYFIDSAKYFMFSCSTFVHITNVNTGQNVINVTIYPNVTGNESDRHTYGTKIYNIFYLEMPLLNISDCPTTMVVGEQLTCTCKRTDKSVINFTVHWYETGTDLIAANETISFTAHVNQPVFYCQSNNVRGWESARLYYRPIVVLTETDVNDSKLTLIITFVTLACALSSISITLWCFKRKRQLRGIEKVEYNVWYDVK